MFQTERKRPRVAQEKASQPLRADKGKSQEIEGIGKKEWTHRWKGAAKSYEKRKKERKTDHRPIDPPTEIKKETQRKKEDRNKKQPNE
mmetsp:Transcript_21588/g.42914  ORF Transcript_21588/g.42914 Transcript_21588/m.42914 type:complete len:88 (+) Transcript_21588:377-640(+)